jgi:hypothetical protein
MITDEEIKIIFEWADKYEISGKREKGKYEWGIGIDDFHPYDLETKWVRGWEDKDKWKNIRKGIPRNKDTLLQITHLNLSNFKISNIPDEFWKLTQITHINFHGCEIKDIKSFQKIDSLKQLVYLDLSSNYLSHIPTDLSKLSNLKHLNLSQNNIKELPNNLEKFISLISLDLSWNSIWHNDVLGEGLNNILPLCKCINLEFLDLHWNEGLHQIPNEIENLTKLRYINFSGCHNIQELPNSFAHLYNLEYLNVANPGILPSHLSKFTASFPKLKYLNDQPYASGLSVINTESNNKKIETNIIGKNIIYYGVPGTGKTHKLKLDKESKKYDAYKFVTFHQSYGYEEFMEGMKAVSDGNVNISYRVEDGIFKTLCKEAENNPDKHYALFIDEINRGNISKILGELITLIELDKRGNTSLILPYSKEPFSVPKNISIIATMNTADRSIAPIDTALRRRFEFEEILPELDPLKKIHIEDIELDKMLEAINERIEYLYDRDHLIGHAYLLNVKNIDDLKEIMKRNIIPLLAEYFYEDWGNIRLVLNNDFVVEKNVTVNAKIRQKIRDKKIYKINVDNFTGNELAEEFKKIYRENEQ